MQVTVTIKSGPAPVLPTVLIDAIREHSRHAGVKITPAADCSTSSTSSTFAFCVQFCRANHRTAADAVMAATQFTHAALRARCNKYAVVGRARLGIVLQRVVLKCEQRRPGVLHRMAHAVPMDGLFDNLETPITLYTRFQHAVAAYLRTEPPLDHAADALWLMERLLGALTSARTVEMVNANARRTWVCAGKVAAYTIAHVTAEPPPALDTQIAPAIV